MSTRTVGSARAHDSALKHTTGEAQYIDDLPEPVGLLHGYLVCASEAHAKLNGIDTSEALGVPGVVRVLTAEDVPGHNLVGPIFADEELFPTETVAYRGHPVCLVLADSYRAAKAGAAKVKINLEPLPALLDVKEALAAESFDPSIAPMKMVRGEWEAALKTAPIRFQAELLMGGQDHFYLETQVALATPQEDLDCHVLSSTQHPTEVQHLVAEVLGVPMNAVTVETRRMGGGFGGKESQASQVACFAAIGARVTGRPVKLRLGRDEDMIITGKRHPFFATFDVGVDQNGVLLGADIFLAAQAGWSCDLTPAVISRAMSHVDNGYFFPAIHVKGVAVRTNTQSNTAFRGFGGPQGMIVGEAIMDEIARRLDLDPLEVRKRNFYTDARNLTPYHQPVEHFRLPEMIDQVLASGDYQARRAAADRFNDSNPMLKKGIALSPVKFGVSFNKPEMNQAGALVHVYTDGSIKLNHGGTEMGQGLNTKVAMVVAEVFGVDLDKVKITATNTGKVPNTSPTAASSGADLNGAAAKNAAEIIKARMAEVAAAEFTCGPAELDWFDGEIRHGNKVLTFPELASKCHMERVSLSSTGYYRTPKIHFDRETMTGRPFFYFAHGVALAEVAVDTLTGEWKLLRADLLHDVGASLNPALDKGQIEGAFAQGMGWLTMEELVWKDDGTLATHAPSTYKIPTARDLPEAFYVNLLQGAPNPEATVFRSKAVGEPPLMLAISVWLALRDAVASLAPAGMAPTLQAPATPEAILFACEAAKEAADGR